LEHSISKTCIYVAAGRAVGAREPDPSVRNPDDIVGKLLGDATTFGLDHPVVRALGLDYTEAMKTLDVVGNVRMMTVRTRFIDDALQQAVAGGATQVVILGAGFDTHAYRFQELLAQARVFEVDRAATQALKKQRVNQVLGAPPSNLTYVAIDFQHDDLAGALSRYGYDRARRTFVILEGVTMYLPEDAVRTTLRFVASHASGSGIVFDFVYRPLVDLLSGDLASVPAMARPYLQRFMDLIKDEPWVFGIPVDGEREFLSQCGLELRELLSVGGEESVKRYLTRADGTQVGAEAIGAAMARMAERARAAGQSPEQQVASAAAREQQRRMTYQLAHAFVP
jgi:methyltransferase (TIGR00027 family)